MIQVKLLTAGASFGELALIDNKPRAATIIAKEHTILAVLDKNNYKNILSNFKILDIQIYYNRGKREIKNDRRNRIFIENKNILALEL